MNERIRELYNKVFAESMNMRWNIEDAEKFAELIVLECCVALNPMLRDMISRGQGVDAIKKHFGVES